MIGTRMSVVRFPGTPPMECLSTTRSSWKSRTSPVWTIASARATTSPSGSRCTLHAVTKAANSALEYRPATISWIIFLYSGGVNGLPYTFFLMSSTEEGGGAGLMSTSTPSGAPNWRNPYSLNPTSFFLRNGSSVILSTARIFSLSHASSTRSNGWSPNAGPVVCSLCRKAMTSR